MRINTGAFAKGALDRRLYNLNLTCAAANLTGGKFR
jgi:hypothetical protein